MELSDDDAYGDALAMDAAAIERATGFLMDELEAADANDGDGSSERPRDGERGHERDASHAMPGVSYRLLCPMTRIGRVIGKEGCVIRRTREETGARVKVQTAARGADERVIIVGSADIGDEDGIGASVDCGVTAAEAALFRIFDTIIGEEGEGETANAATAGRAAVPICRLLVPRSQVGSLIGKGGLVISAIRASSGATVRVMPAMMLPSCASQGDELIQITSPPRDADGNERDRESATASVRCALRLIAHHLREHPARTLTSESARSPMDAFVMGNAALGSNDAIAGGERGGNGKGGQNMSTRLNSNGVYVPGGAEISFRLLCPVSKTGSVIGRNGEVIQMLRSETGAKVKVCEQVNGADERIICVSSSDDGLTPLLAAQIAVFRAYRCIVESAGNEVPVPFRLLVQTSQIGCLIGKGGSIIKQIRNETGATVRVLPPESLPACANEDDELLEIGQWPADACASAIRIVSGRLRGNIRHKAAERISNEHMQNVIPSATWQQTEMMYGMTQTAYGSSEDGFGPTYEIDANGHTEQGATSSITINIPHDQVGSVLGRAGCNIDIAREVSGAKLKLHKVATPAYLSPSQDGKRVKQFRHLDVSGTPEQVALAQEIVARFIASSGVMLPEYEHLAANPKRKNKPIEREVPANAA